MRPHGTFPLDNTKSATPIHPEPYMQVIRSLFILLLLLGFLILPASSWARTSFTCDYYDIIDMPDQWDVSMAPGLNTIKNSLGYYVNKEKNVSVLVQVGETEEYTTLEEETESLLKRLEKQGVTILSAPVREGYLMRIEATATGAPTTIWVGTNGDIIALTFAAGNKEDAFSFFDYMRNQDPMLLPSASTIRR